MRVTTFGMNARYLQDLSDIMSKYQDLQQQLSTGRKLNQPSDDPVGLSVDITIQTSLAQIEQWKNNADSGLTKLQTADASLNSLQSVLGNIRTEILQAMNGTNTPSDLNQIQSVVLQQIQNVVQIANTNDGEQYIFAGVTGKQAPLSMSVAGTTITFTWSGGGAQKTTIGGGNMRIPVNVDGAQVFNTSPSGGVPSLLANLADIYSDLSNNPAKLDADLQSLDANLDHISAIRADVGGRMSLLQATQTQLSAMVNNLQQSKGKVEDADLAQVITQLSTQQTVYQAALEAGIRLILPTLADVLQ
ncbi:MAG: flagellar hook-associated protein FlgL [Alicyclobacillaceae bacterium]|nr:flagellar hook-associated protein FlgL [Alicyclobacillaceae bacterium]